VVRAPEEAMEDIKDPMAGESSDNQPKILLEADQGSEKKSRG
jgi:hypothetical protein